MMLKTLSNESHRFVQTKIIEGNFKDEFVYCNHPKTFLFHNLQQEHCIDSVLAFYVIIFLDMTLYIIANPHSGNRSAQEVIKRLKNKLNQEIAVFLTRYSDDEENQVNDVLETFQPEKDRLLILGGDGTLSKVLY